MANLFLVVMAGGSGTRFWPKSTSRRPKQLLAFGGGEGADTLLEMTLKRFDGIVPADQRLIVTTELLASPVSEQAGRARVLAEPAGRNTAPCVYWAAREVAKSDPDAVMLVMPSDHYIADPAAFAATVRAAAARAASHDELVTLGVKPSRPETGYGYLKIGEGLGGECSRVAAFVEKPNLEKAQAFLREGNYLWNGGMFLWRAEVILAAFDQFMPEMKKEWEAAGGDVAVAYPRLTATSIDYGVMEKARNVVAFPLDCGWDDLGSWISLEGMADVLRAHHEAGAVTAGDVVAVESSGNIIDVPGKTVALLGAKDLVIVEQGGVLMVADKRRAQDIKLLVERIKKEKPSLA